MRRVLHTPVGAELYGKRNGMIETWSSATPSSTARSTASSAEAEPPAGQNGA